MSTNYEKAFNAFAEFSDGLTAFEFTELMDDPQDKRCASARLSQFTLEGLARKEGSRPNPVTGQSCALYIPTGRMFSQRLLEKRAPQRKRRRPTDAELVELRKWKADAIKRFPELAVSEEMYRAREVLKDILNDEGSLIKASLVASGELDDSEAMRIVLRMMRNGEAK